jgi:hypothetical protein
VFPGIQKPREFKVPGNCRESERSAGKMKDQKNDKVIV